jgi:multidrug efflux system outer membrane protein
MTVDNNPSPASEQTTHSAWWHALNDPIVTQFADQIRQDNIELKIAQSRIIEARSLRQIAQADLLPTVDATAGTSRGNRRTVKTGDVSDIGFDAAWEIDLFGKTRNQIRAAEARVNQTIADRDAVQNSLIAELARSVTEWRGAREQQRSVEALLKAQDTQIDLYNVRTQAGLINGTFAQRAKAQRAQTAVQLPQIQNKIETTQYQIETLLGMKPHALKEFFVSETSTGLISVEVTPFLDQPIDIVKNRPDLRRARAALAETQANVAAAEASLWPSLSIGTFFGVQNLSSGSASNPAWSMGASALAPALRFGQLREAIKVANEREAQALLAYQNTQLQALQEIQTALSDYLNGITSVQAQQAALNDRQATVSMVQERFNRGLSDMIDVTTAQAELENAALSLVNLQTQTAIAYIRLQKSLAQ